MQDVCHNGRETSYAASRRAQPPSREAVRIASPHKCDVICSVGVDLDHCIQIVSGHELQGAKVYHFSTAAEFLNRPGIENADCVILNTYLPDTSGLELQSHIVRRGNPPIIFISQHADVSSAVTAMKAGAVEFLTFPVDGEKLALAVRKALAQERKLRQKRADLTNLQDCFQRLTPREREVLPLIVGGLLNKQAAAILGISEVTLQIHRSQVMRKMEAQSFADLVRMALRLRIPYWREGRPSLVENTRSEVSTSAYA